MAKRKTVKEFLQEDEPRKAERDAKFQLDLDEMNAKWDAVEKEAAEQHKRVMSKLAKEAARLDKENRRLDRAVGR